MAIDRDALSRLSEPTRPCRSLEQVLSGREIELE